MPSQSYACMAWGRRLVLALCGSLALAAGGAGEPVANQLVETGVQERTWSFNIPPQAVVSALRSWSAVTGRDWAYVGGSSLEGIRSPGVKGSLTGREALDFLLKDTGLSYVVLPGGGISISRTHAAAGVGDGMV